MNMKNRLVIHEVSKKKCNTFYCLQAYFDTLLHKETFVAIDTKHALASGVSLNCSGTVSMTAGGSLVLWCCLKMY